VLQVIARFAGGWGGPKGLVNRPEDQKIRAERSGYENNTSAGTQRSEEKARKKASKGAGYEPTLDLIDRKKSE